MDLKEEDILGSKIHDHWYYISKGRAMRDFLGDIKTKETLDVGAGSGIFSRQLLDHGFCEKAVCVDPNYAEEKLEIHNGRPIEFVKSVGSASPSLVLMMDVLEHVEDDVALLKEYVDSMETGGHLLITVPAFQFMWSSHDVFLEHYRRYTIAMLEGVIKEAGLTPVKSRYFFGSLFPVMAVVRLLRRVLSRSSKLEPQSDLKLYPGWLNKSLTVVHDVERRSVFGFNKLFGLSVFSLCEKK